MMQKMRAFNWLAANAWLLDSAVLQDIAAIARREFASETLDLEALLARNGKPMDSSHQVEIRDGVAVVTVNGVISRYANLFTAICGGTSTELLAQDFTEALHNPAVSGIALNIDSPGGEAKGIHELSEMIFDARSRKPVTAYVGGTGASAAYWIATAANELVIDATAELGSIGVVTGIRLFKPQDGEQSFEIVSSQSPRKRLDPASEAGKADIQSKVDQLADVFIDRVARNMGVTSEQVVAEFGQGGTFIGSAAVERGMAHRLGSLEGVIEELSGNKRMTTAKTKTDKQPEQKPVITLASGATVADAVAAIQTDHPEIAAALTEQATVAAKAEGIEEGRTAENARVKSVFDQSFAGHDELIKTLAMDGQTTGAEAAMKVLAVERELSSSYLDKRKAEAPDVDDVASDDEKSTTKAMDAKELATAARQLVATAASEGRKLSIADAMTQIKKGIN